MTRSRLGKSKRLAAFLCALLLTLEAVAFPLTQAKAAATAALATVGFGVTTAAFLAACGIYPYWASADVSETFDWGDWETEDLAALLQEYNAANVASPIASQQIQAFLQGATLAVGSAVWEKLRAFAEWIKTKYAVADNQTGVELGKQGAFLPVLSNPLRSVLVSSGYNYGSFPSSTGSNPVLISAYASSNISNVYPYAVSSSSDLLLCALSSQSFVIWGTYSSYSSDDVPPGYSAASASVDGQNYYYGSFGGTGFATSTENLSVDVYSSHSDAARFYFNMQGQSDFSGITADTTTVSIPDALPQGTEYGGLRVSGLPAATTAESVTDAVQDSVGERLKTPVEVVEVELAPGTEVDSETGAITQNPVVIEAPVEETIPAISALVPAQEFIRTMMTALQTKFPFCLPFDFMRLVNAVAKSPEAPVITMTFFDRIGGGHYTVTVDLSPWDDIAAIVRRLEAMILFLGFWLNFDKFNMLNVLLGQIG